MSFDYIWLRFWDIEWYWYYLIGYHHIILKAHTNHPPTNKNGATKNQGLNLDAAAINWKFRSAFSITHARLIRLKTKSWILAPWTRHNFGSWDSIAGGWRPSSLEHMDVSKIGGFPPKSSVKKYHYKPSILWAPLFLETPASGFWFEYNSSMGASNIQYCRFAVVSEGWFGILSFLAGVLEFHAVHISCYIEINWHCTDFSHRNLIYVSVHAWFISFHISSKHVLACFLSASKVFRCRRSHGQRLRRKRKKWRKLCCFSGVASMGIHYFRVGYQRWFGWLSRKK